MHNGDMITGEELYDFVMEHQVTTDKYRVYKEMYESNPEVLSLPIKESYKPDNRVVVNFAKKVVDTFNGFSSSKPIKLTHENKSINERINDFWKSSNMDSDYSDLSKTADINGISYLYLYQNEDSETRMTIIEPTNAFVIFDDSIRKRKKYGVIYSYDDDNRIQGTLLTRTHALAFKEHDHYRFEIEEPNDTILEGNRHMFNKVPLVYFVNNNEETGLIEPIETMINAYDKAISEKANDVDYFADAYMKVLGAYLEEEQLDTLRDNRVINIDGDGSDKVVVDFLQKPNADEAQENLLDRLERLIFSVSMIPDLSNFEGASAASGYAREMKLQPMKYLANIKERKFQRGLNEVLELFFSLPTNMTDLERDEWKNVVITSHRELPTDIESEIDAVNKLSGEVSDETRLSLLSFIDNAKEEITKRDEEQLGSYQRRRELPSYLTDDEMS